jgi:hypothetical protein
MPPVGFVVILGRGYLQRDKSVGRYRCRPTERRNGLRRLVRPGSIIESAFELVPGLLLDLSSRSVVEVLLLSDSMRDF